MKIKDIRINISVRKIIRYYIPPLLTVLWLCFIFGNSLKNGLDSGEQSGTIHRIANFIIHALGFRGSISHAFIRKAAHFSEFAILAALLGYNMLTFGLINLRKERKRELFIILTATPACFVFASIDEFLQRFSAGRAPQFSDILIDTSGALCATLIFLMTLLIIHRSIHKIKKVKIRKDIKTSKKHKKKIKIKREKS